MSSDNLDTLLDELSSYKFPTHIDNQQEQDVEINEEDIKSYVLKQSKALIDVGVGTVKDMSGYVTQSQNPDDAAALAEVMSATSKLLDSLNKSVLLDKKAEKDKEITQMQIDAKKEIAKLKGANTITNNTNVLIASRDEIMKKLFGSEEQPVIENI